MVWLQSAFIALPHNNHSSILLRNACRINEGKKKMEGKKKGREKGKRDVYPNQLRLGDSLIWGESTGSGFESQLYDF